MSDFKDIKLNNDILNNIKSINSFNHVASRVQKDHEKTIQAINKSRETKEQEELRRHNELVTAMKNAAENGATIVIGDNANGIQIQQNSDNAQQFMTNSQEFDYDKTFDILNEIKEYFEYPQFERTFQDKTDFVKQLVEEIVEAVKSKENPSLIKKSLTLLKDLTIGAGSSLIATGILGLLKSIL